MSKFILGYILFLILHFVRNKLPIKCLKEFYLLILFIVFIPLPKINLIMVPVKSKNTVNKIYLAITILVIIGLIYFCYQYYNAVKFKKFVKEIGNRYKDTNIYFCEEVGIPCTIGVVNPIIVLPFKEYKQCSFKYILRHEETHVLQGDNFFKIMFSLYSCLIWFLPLRKRILQDFTDECEIRCDYLVCKKFNIEDKKEYAKLIIKYGMNSSNNNISDSINCMSSYERLSKRVTRILKDYKTNMFVYFIIVGLVIILFIFSSISFHVQFDKAIINVDSEGCCSFTITEMR